jgi:hypothetical protein
VPALRGGGAAGGSRFTATRQRSSNDAGRRWGGAAAEKEAPSLEQRVQTMQRDSGTYCDEPDDAEDFEAWRATFVLESKSDEVEEILVSNSFMRWGVYKLNAVYP